MTPKLLLMAAAIAAGVAGCCATGTKGEASGTGVRPPASAIVNGVYHPELDKDVVATGRDIALKQCSSCHAVDAEMTSPRPEAPPMLSILMRYDGDKLASDLIEGVRVGHDEMPRFDFNVIAADALVAYLRSIERTPRAAER